MNQSKIRVAVVGLGFGTSFVPIYLRHPDVEYVGIVDNFPATLDSVGQLGLADARAVKVHCFGSGAMREELHTQYGNPFPIQTAIFQLDKPALAMEVTRSLFHTACNYVESF